MAFRGSNPSLWIDDEWPTPSDGRRQAPPPDDDGDGDDREGGADIIKGEIMSAHLRLHRIKAEPVGFSIAEALEREPRF